MSSYAVVDPATGETVQTYPTITNEALAAAIEQAGNVVLTARMRAEAVDGALRDAAGAVALGGDGVNVAGEDDPRPLGAVEERRAGVEGERRGRGGRDRLQ